LTLCQRTQDNFGSFNPEGEAEAKLNNFKCKKTLSYESIHQFHSYLHVGNAALHQQAYNGLGKTYQEHIIHHHKPNTLKDSMFCESH